MPRRNTHCEERHKRDLAAAKSGNLRQGRFRAACLMVLMLAATGVPVLAEKSSASAEAGSAEERAAGMTWAFTPDQALPDVLIIGDSISIAYTLHVRKELQEVANVYRPFWGGGKVPANCADTAFGMKWLDGWLGNRDWRVILFNFGLHDLKYLDEKRGYTTPEKGKQVASLDAYEANLRAIVARLKKTGATLVWASTTPVPEGSPGRVKDDEASYNDRASKVMKENGVVITDLRAALGNRLGELQKPRDVHFTDTGSKVLATAVASSVRQALAAPAIASDGQEK